MSVRLVAQSHVSNDIASGRAILNIVDGYAGWLFE